MEITEQFAEEIANVHDDKKEVVVALLLGVCQGHSDCGADIQQREVL